MAIRKTADLVDGHDDKLTFCDYPLTKFGQAEGFEGEIVTLKTFEDNALLREVLEQPGNGRVLVVDGGASTRVAIVGDQIAAVGMNNGWAGLVLNGSIRDSVDIDALEEAAADTEAVVDEPAPIEIPDDALDLSDMSQVALDIQDLSLIHI